MDRIAQEKQFRQRVMLYAEHHGMEETANRYHICRKTVWKWKKRWDGTAASLEEQSRRPRHSPRQQDAGELKLVRRLRKKYGEDMILAYQKAMAYGYRRSYGCFKRTAAGMQPPKKTKKKRQNKPYQAADYPGQKVQVDVKFVPAYCIAGEGKYYQYTAKDEYSRWTYREMYDEHSTYSSKCFVEQLIKAAPFKIGMIQTDNGSEFTKALWTADPEDLTLFEQCLKDQGIFYHRIRVATPRHNGKVERQHRIDEMRFYKHMRMFSLEDGRKQLAKYQRLSNTYIMTCLGMKSPNEVLAQYQRKK